jgi:hypothetical protein
MQLKAQPLTNLADVSKTPEFGHLSQKQAAWILKYIKGWLDTGSFDATASTLASYDCKTVESARTFSYQLLTNPKIILVLNRFFGNTPEQSFLEQVERACYTRKLTVAQVDALKLYGELRGWTGRRKRDTEDAAAKKAESPEVESIQTFPIGAVITQDGKSYRVVAEEIS